jgi:hypothetical protein
MIVEAVYRIYINGKAFLNKTTCLSCLWWSKRSCSSEFWVATASPLRKKMNLELPQSTFSTNPLSNFFYFRRFQALSHGQSESRIIYLQESEAWIKIYAICGLNDNIGTIDRELISYPFAFPACINFFVQTAVGSFFEKKKKMVLVKMVL